jgi:hypothetical protein
MVTSVLSYGISASKKISAIKWHMKSRVGSSFWREEIIIHCIVVVKAGSLETMLRLDTDSLYFS